MPDIFQRFRRPTSEPSVFGPPAYGPLAVGPPGAGKAPPEIRLLLDRDQTGAFLTVTDRHLREIRIDPADYGGSRRDLLQRLETIRLKQSFLIDWQNPHGRIYLHEHPHLIDPAARGGLLVNQRGRSLALKDGLHRLTLKIDQDDSGQLLSSRVVLNVRQRELASFLLLSDRHALHNNAIYPLHNTGPHFAEIQLLNTPVTRERLDTFLSLFFSHFSNMELHYRDFRVISGRPRHPLPCLIFSEIDENGFLHLRLAHSVEDHPPDLLSQYDLSRIARIQEAEGCITVSELISGSRERDFEPMIRLLRQYQKELAGGPEFLREENALLIPPRLAELFLTQELPQLAGQFRLFGVKHLKKYRIRQISPKLRFQLASGIDFLEGSCRVAIDEEEFPVFQLLSLYKKHHYIPLSNGERGIVNQGFIDRLERIIHRSKKKDRIAISFFDLPLVDELIDKRISGDGYVRSREVFRGFNRLKDQKIHLPLLRGSLRDYQKYGFKWLNYLDDCSLGGCLADDMGLGKTVQAIALMSHIYRKKEKNKEGGIPCLIVVPKTLLFNWQQEIARFTPHLSCYTYYGGHRDPKEGLQANLMLTTYALIRRDIRALSRIQFRLIVLDEAQAIKNVNSQLAKAVMLLKGEHRLALSGTPMENNLSELYSIFRFLNPAMLGSAPHFLRHYALPIQKDGSREVMAELKKKIYPFILRRLKADVAGDLPAKVEQILPVEMSRAQSRLYESRRRYYRAEIKRQITTGGLGRNRLFIFQALSELRQIASIPELKSNKLVSSPKRELLLGHLKDMVSNQHKALVFSNFLGSLEHIASDLEAAGIDYLVMTGATRDRRTLVEHFQQDTAVKVFLMTLKTGGLGLNLTAAEYVFIFDPWWNLAAENQAVDRTHRIGQKNSVFCYRLITKDTIEEKILLLQEQKKELFDRIITSDGAMFKKLEEADLEYLLG